MAKEIERNAKKGIISVGITEEAKNKMKKDREEEVVWRNFQTHPNFWEPVQEKFEVIADKAWKLSRSSDTKRNENGSGLRPFLESGQGAWLDKGHPKYGQVLEVRGVE